MKKNITSVSIIGTGNVGWHLAIALFKSGIEIRHIIARSSAKAGELARIVDASPVANFTDIIKHPDMYLVCVSDDAIPGVVDIIGDSGAVIVHTSGSTGFEVFTHVKENYGVFYPLQTFTRGNEMNYQEIPFLVEGDSKKVVEMLKGLADTISGISREADSEMRKKIHIAAVFACNFSNHLAAVAETILKESGLEVDLLFPLMKETYRKIIHIGPLKAQTGPAARNDTNMIGSHLDALVDFPEELKMYKILTDNIIRYRKKQNE
ncbi:MAG: Rossmann-like and DUF2520 domain-containing protein [Bacteroidales bacterium]